MYIFFFNFRDNQKEFERIKTLRDEWRKKERNNRYFFLDINSGVHKRRKAHTIEIAELIKNEGNLGRISIFLSLFLTLTLSSAT
jgi:hypothetical protein